jgi:hypothetical protein
MAGSNRKLAVKKVAARSLELIPQRHGGALLSGGVIGHRGGTGRPPDEFKAYLSSLVTSVEVLSGVEAILTDPDRARDPARARLFLEAFKWAAEHAYGKATQALTAAAGTNVRIVWEREGPGHRADSKPL